MCVSVCVCASVCVCVCACVCVRVCVKERGRILMEIFLSCVKFLTVYNIYHHHFCKTGQALQLEIGL